VRCSLSRHLVNLSLGVWPYKTEAAPRQLAVTSQLGTLSDMAMLVLRAEASVGQNQMPSAETVAMAIVNRLNMTISQMIAEHLSAGIGQPRSSNGGFQSTIVGQQQFVRALALS
jgi:hypothetical protein